MCITFCSGSYCAFFFSSFLAAYSNRGWHRCYALLMEEHNMYYVLFWQSTCFLFKVSLQLLPADTSCYINL